MKPTKNDRAIACRLLRQLREQRGWSWADQARALHAVAGQCGVAASASTQLSSLQRSIARWESTASGTVPGERYQLLLAHLYARNGFGELTLGTGSDFDILLTALAYYGCPRSAPANCAISWCAQPALTCCMQHAPAMP
jgi:transcriptional regulator with XRE-family HTH domain